MKLYEKPEIKVIETSAEDIIQTSTSTLIPETGGVIVGGPMEFSLTAESGASGDVFQK